MYWQVNRGRIPILPLGQLAFSPQCGFSSTVHGNDIAVAAQRIKLGLVIETAQKVWGAGNRIFKRHRTPQETT